MLATSRSLTSFFPDNVLFVESMDVMMILDVLHEETKPQELKVSKVQSFGSLLDGTLHSYHACSEIIEVTKSFT